MSTVKVKMKWYLPDQCQL